MCPESPATEGLNAWAPWAAVLRRLVGSGDCRKSRTSVLSPLDVRLLICFPSFVCRCFRYDAFLFCPILTPYFVTGYRLSLFLGSSWNVIAHGDARQGKWRGVWRMRWVASTLHTTSEHGVSSITTADAHTSAASSRLNWRPPFRRKTKSGFWFQLVWESLLLIFYQIFQ